MKMRGKRIGLCLLGVIFLASHTAFGQAVYTGTITGRVINEGTGLPGVTVTAKAPQLIGIRTTVTGSNGDYIFPNLPGGLYTLNFELAGFRSVTKSAQLGASQSLTIDVTMGMSAVEAAVEVAATSETVAQTAQQSTTYTAELMGKLPVARTIISAVALTPGVNQNGPNAAVTISGAQSFDNLYTVNGVTIIDNVRGTPFNLFIEDAIQETTTSTSAVSAEWGRFAGGVVNTVTKSGGNVFSGSFRANLNNDAWSAISPAHEKRPQSVLPTYEATLGGPFWKDHVWFFGAYRGQSTSTAFQTASPVSFPYSRGVDEKRYEGKLTLSPVPNHTLTGSVTRISNTTTNYGFDPLPFYDEASIYDRALPQELYVGNYNGVITKNLFVEAQYNSRKFTFVNSGSRFTDLVKGTWIYDRSADATFNSPVFCAVCVSNSEVRSNNEFLLKGTYFLSTPSIGSHNIVVGFDNYRGSRLSNNYQSGSAFEIYATDALFGGGNIYPVIDPDSYLAYWPIPTLAQPTSIRTYSGFINDTWRLNNNLSFNLGVRYDKNAAKDSLGATRADDHAFSPRISAAFDPTGKGTLSFHASFARYVAAIQETQVGSQSSAGSPAYYYYGYGGPTFNTNCDPNVAGSCLTAAEILPTIFNYYGITGPNQFPTKGSTTPFVVGVPGVNTLIPNSLTSPHTDEIAGGVNGIFDQAHQGSFRVDVVYRKSYDFYNLVTNLSTGQVTDDAGNVFDIGLVENLTDPLERKYVGLNTQFAWRPVTGLSVGGNWTWSHTYGNFIGETSGSGPVQATIQQYPEYKQLVWNSPTGNLSQDQRHRVRLFATYDLPVPKAVGYLSVSGIQSYDSGLPYEAVGRVRPEVFIANPGYSTPPTTALSTSNPTYYFSARGAYLTPSVKRTDLALNWSYKFGGLVELFVSPQVLNVFNLQSINVNATNINLTIQDRTNNANLQDFNPFTTKPVLFDPKADPTVRLTSTGCPAAPNAAFPGHTTANYCIPTNFGTARNVNGYQQPRTFRVSMGIRF